ncbi:NAD(P)H-dependent oxidoreductase [bacterium]|nr:NAD(P)H-dependent oxidoreductase [bacterium]
MKKILIFNASPEGEKGNSAQIIKKSILPSLAKSTKTEVIHLAKLKKFKTNKKLLNSIHQASGFIFISGTYWDSWGSPLQKYLEEMTHLEGTSYYLGKPAAVVILNHSVGGKAVLSRLQGVLVTLGFMIPPMSGMVYGVNTDLALKKASKQKSSHQDDFWSLDDLQTIVKNLLLSLKIEVSWASWPVDRKNFKKLWL